MPDARRLRLGLALCFCLALAPPVAQAEQAPSVPRLQEAVDSYLADRAEVEGISGVSVYVSLADRGPGIEVFAGTTDRAGDTPVTGTTLFQIGSNTKGFTAVLLLKLQQEGRLSLDDTVGDWLPQYPAWRDVTVRELLNMTSGIPTYSENPDFSRLAAETPHRHYTLEDLVDYAYPSERVSLPENSGYFYSNTNYILAGMIAEKASGLDYQAALETMLFEPAGLVETYYEPFEYGGLVRDRLAGGYFENPECGLYEPGCEETSLAPLIGRDVRDFDISWAGPAGGIVSTPRDLARWVRAVFGGAIIDDAQLAQLKSTVSTDTGAPLDEVGEDDPRGFGLGFVRVWRPDLGRFWFYEGETLGYRVAFALFDDGVLISAATNSQPAGAEDRLGDLLEALRQATTGEDTQEHMAD